MFYPELFAFLFDDSFSGLSVPSDGQAQRDQIRVRWSEMVDPSCVAEARQSAVWMLSHWLLDQVIQRTEQGDESVVQSIRQAIHRDSTSLSGRHRAGAIPSDQTAPYHLSCSSPDFACG